MGSSPSYRPAFWDDLSPEYRALVESWARSLRASGRSPSTLRVYIDAAAQLGRFLAERGYSTNVADVTRHQVREFTDDQLTRWAKNTAASRFRALRVWFGWLVAEGEIDRSPMAGMSGVAVPEQPPALLSDDEVARLFAVCDGRDLIDRRDAAILRLMADSGIRRSELVGLTTDDLDLDGQLVTVLGKGGRRRFAPFGPETAAAIDRYLRARARHPLAHLPALWLTDRGALTGFGLNDLVARRGTMAGIRRMHPHRLRHYFADRWLRDGGTEGDLMQLGGWRSQAVMRRYGASAAAERALEAYRRVRG